MSRSKNEENFSKELDELMEKFAPKVKAIDMKLYLERVVADISVFEDNGEGLSFPCIWK